MNRMLPMQPGFRLLDWLLRPIMFVLGGCKADSIQETHYWHCQRIDMADVDPRFSVSIPGDDKSGVAANSLLPFPRFHAPLFGGWRNYAVLQVQETAPIWHVGWVHRKFPSGSRPRAHVQRLPIESREIKVLKQPRGFLTDFFALDANGRQLLLKAVDEGVLGDMRYPEVRLF